MGSIQAIEKVLPGFKEDYKDKYTEKYIKRPFSIRKTKPKKAKKGA